MYSPEPKPPVSYSTEKFSLHLSLSETDLFITMQLHDQPISTRDLFDTNKILEEKLPSIFLNQCFNEKNLSFYEEAKNTEIGHLFEHILLEKLVLKKSALRKNSKPINGKTSWNWVKDPVGKFYIRLKPVHLDKREVLYSVEKAIELTNYIISSHNRRLLN